MPAAPPNTKIFTLSDSTGVVLTVTIVADPSTGAFDVNPAIHAVNSSTVAQRVDIYQGGNLAHRFSIPVGTTDVTPAQMSGVGFTNISQLSDISVTLA